ncbi:MAG: cobalamin biosynthesis protein [Dehalococcoidia bacterium]
MIELNAIQIVAVLVFAVGADLIFGEPGNALHPVAWLGKIISLELRGNPRTGKIRQLVFGMAIVLLTTGAIIALLSLFKFYVNQFNTIVYTGCVVVLFKFTFSMQGLKKAGSVIKLSLTQNNLDRARAELRALVSRPTEHLNRKQIVSAAVESLAENTCDSFVAPLFYFIIFGLPGAAAYRVINTFDAMIGYHGKWEYTGKCAARLDDILNFIPARITALVIILSTWIYRKNTAQAWYVMLRDSRKTQSPNAGLIMSALAGALGVQLEKEGYYTLGDELGTLSITTLEDYMHLIAIAAGIWTGLLILSQVVYYVAS